MRHMTYLSEMFGHIMRVFLPQQILTTSLCSYALLLYLTEESTQRIDKKKRAPSLYARF
jgi:hypothetical protein